MTKYKNKKKVFGLEKENSNQPKKEGIGTS